MNFKISILAIIMSTCAIIGIMHLLVENVLSPGISSKKNDAKTLQVKQKPPAQNFHKRSTSTNSAVKLQQLSIKENSMKTSRNSLDKKDIEIIKGIASLSAKQITDELETLKSHMESKNLFTKLEHGLLTPPIEAKAKKTIERYALLGLETRRRKYLDIESELNDPIVAHRDSLQEIRHILDNPRE